MGRIGHRVGICHHDLRVLPAPVSETLAPGVRTTNAPPAVLCASGVHRPVRVSEPSR